MYFTYDTGAAWPTNTCHGTENLARERVLQGCIWRDGRGGRGERGEGLEQRRRSLTLRESSFTLRGFDITSQPNYTITGDPLAGGLGRVEVHSRRGIRYYQPHYTITGDPHAGGLAAVGVCKRKRIRHYQPGHTITGDPRAGGLGVVEGRKRSLFGRSS